MIEKRGNRWCLVSEAGDVIGCHDTEEQAQAQERAIKARQAGAEDLATAAKRPAEEEPRPATYGELEAVEILQVGALPARGVAFTKSDLEEIAQNTNQLIREGLHHPPGKLGHDDNQAFAQASGLPATGWVESLSVVGEKLVARLRDVPRILMRAFKERLFRKVSSEVYFEFPHPRTHERMGKVLRAVAFLGADIPEVKGLADFFGEQRVYSLGDLDKLGQHASMAEVEIRITIPDAPAPEAAAPTAPPANPEVPMAPAPGPLRAEGLAGRDLELFRQAERAAGELKDKGEAEFSQEGEAIDHLLRFVGRAGAAFCASSPEFRANSDNPEELCAWLEARARERGLVQTQQLTEGGEDMDKVKELEGQLAEAHAKFAESQKDAEGLRSQLAKLGEDLTAERKAKADARVASFIEAHKEVITPAIEPSFRQLCEFIGDGETTVKLAEGKEEKRAKLEVVLAFVEDLCKAKVAKLGEVAPGSSADSKEKAPVKVPVGANYRVQLHEEAMRLQQSEPSLTYWQAVSRVAKDNPELAA